MNNTNTQKLIIIKDRAETYKDFTLNLLYYIDKYYLGQKTLNNDADIYNYYSFCYNKTCEGFVNEGIYFEKNKELKEYFYNYYYIQYFTTKSGVGTLTYYEKFWNSVFDIGNERNKNFMPIFVEAYAIFDFVFSKKTKKR